MTRHISEELLLKKTLGLLEGRAARSVSGHLEDCASCRKALEEMERSIRGISQVDPLIEMEPPLLPRAGIIRWFRMAAVFAAGIGLGALAASELRAPDVTVIGQQVVPTARSTDLTGFVPRDGVRWYGVGSR